MWLKLNLNHKYIYTMSKWIFFLPFVPYSRIFEFISTTCTYKYYLSLLVISYAWRIVLNNTKTNISTWFFFLVFSISFCHWYNWYIVESLVKHLIFNSIICVNSITKLLWYFSKKFGLINCKPSSRMTT